MMYFFFVFYLLFLYTRSLISKFLVWIHALVMEGFLSNI